MYLPDNLELKESPIHGLGIFATKNIKKEQFLGDYIGILMDYKSFTEKYGKDTQYTYRLGRLNKFIVSKENRNWINYINENMAEPNVYLKKKGCFALKDINANTELTLNYGKNYIRDY
jgi:SET domain-containing protein